MARVELGAAGGRVGVGGVRCGRVAAVGGGVMGQCIVKVAPDVDRYVIWSSIVDAPVSYSCTREQALAWVVEEWKCSSEQAEQHVDRADRLGSSDRAVGFGRWDDDDLTVMEGSPSDGWYHLPRARLAAYMDALDREDEAAAQALLVCFERFDDE